MAKLLAWKPIQHLDISHFNTFKQTRHFLPTYNIPKSTLLPQIHQAPTQEYLGYFLPTYQIHNLIEDSIAKTYLCTFWNTTLENIILLFIPLKPYALSQNGEVKFAAWWVRPLMGLMGGGFGPIWVTLHHLDHFKPTLLLRQCPARKQNEKGESGDMHCE